jgi:hypothetical protein
MNKILQEMVDEDPSNLPLAKALEIAYNYRKNNPYDGQKDMTEDEYFEYIIGKMEDKGLIDVE